MTTIDPRVSQVSQGWEWTRDSMYVIKSNTDYTIAAMRSGEGWCFVASTPKVKIDPNAYYVRYGLGDRVPPSAYYKQPYARQTIGYYRAADHDGATTAARDAAKRACFDHWLAGQGAADAA